MRSHRDILALLAVLVGTIQYAFAQGGLLAALQDRTCNVSVVPSPPLNFILISKDSAIEASWWTPKNKPCNVTYELSTVAADGAKPVVVETSQTRATIEDLTNGVNYKVTILVR